MKLIKFFFSLAFTLLLIYALNNRFVIGNTPIPPLGKFLDPFQGFWQNASPSALPYRENINLSGLSEPVSVKYDSMYVPHIFAQNNNDLFRTQGYILAQHRLWQMDFQTRAAAGRISEIVGKAALDFDLLQRRKGMVYGAEKTVESMKANPELWAYLNSYAEGVNAFISNCKYKYLPVEYKLLGYEPEPWTPLKSALLLQYMIDNLTGWDQDLEKTNAYNYFGPEIFDKLFPNYTENINPVVPSPDRWGFENVTTTPRPDSIAFKTNYITSVHDMPDPDNGSNNWAVAGWKTKSGKPILCSDMHLGLNLPSLWFLVELSAPDYNTMGFALAGNIGVVAGFNQDNAWAFTDVSRDERDWYKIDFTDDSRSEYLFDGTKLKSNQVIEEIKVRGEESVFDTVIYTHHGPVVYDKSFPSNSDEENFALKWIGHTPSRVQEALLGLNRSKSYADYINALKKWDSPAQHVAFASTSGDIAIRVQGLWPNKFKDQGLFIMDGSQKEMEWPAFIPTDHYAYQYNPERGYISSANQHSVDQQYPYWQGWASTDHYRGRRINRILEAYDSASIAPSDMMKLQQDSYGLLPSEALPLLLDSLIAKRPEIARDSIFQALRGWDFIYKTEPYAPAVFISWWNNFRGLLWDEMKHDSIALRMPTDFQTNLLLTKNELPNALIDNKDTEQIEYLSDIIAMSYDSMKTDLAKWMDKNDKTLTWGNYKNTSVIHLARLPAFSRTGINIDGEDDVVNSTKSNHGPSQRIVVEMTSPPQAWAIIPGGQSGNPGNPAYDNMIEMWRDGRYFKLNFYQKESESKGALLTQVFSND